jgi:hypothetical protein
MNGLFFFQLPARPNTGIERMDLPWRKKCKGSTRGVTVHKQQWLRQMDTHHYWKVSETTVFQECKEATCDLLCQLESVDDVGDFQTICMLMMHHSVH